VPVIVGTRRCRLKVRLSPASVGDAAFTKSHDSGKRRQWIFIFPKKKKDERGKSNVFKDKNENETSFRFDVISLNAMTKSYSGCSSQTIRIDPDRHLKNYQCRKESASRGIQTTLCILDSCENEEGIEHKRVGAREEDDSDSSLGIEEEMQRRRNPTQPADFEALQSELLQWRRREERKVTITARTEEERQEMKKITLKKEAHLLRKIEQLKNSATEKHKTEKTERTMEAMSQPKQWTVSDGAVISVDTPETCRARQLKTMYDELNRKVEKGTQMWVRRIFPYSQTHPVVCVLSGSSRHEDQVAGKH